MKEKIKSEMRFCEICGYPVVNCESGVCMRCEKCGWQSGGDNIEYEKKYGISYPMVVPLSRAGKQYKEGKPFKATFEDFIHGLACLRQPLAERVDKELKAVDKNKLL